MQIEKTILLGINEIISDVTREKLVSSLFATRPEYKCSAFCAVNENWSHIDWFLYVYTR